MARPPKNSAKLPIPRALLHTSSPLVTRVTSRDVIAFLETVGAGLNPGAFRMNLKRYAERGLIARSRVGDAQLHEPLYLYYPNERTRSTVVFLANQRGELTDSVLAFLSFGAGTMEARQDLHQEKSQKRSYQYLWLMMMNNTMMPGGVGKTSWPRAPNENPSFEVIFREPMYRDGEKVTHQDGRPAYRITKTYATWRGDRSVPFTQPSNADEAEIWNGIEWEPLKPEEWAVTHRLAGFEPVIMEGKPELDEFDQVKCRPITAEYTYRGESWEPLRHERKRRSKKLHPVSESG